MTLRDELRHAVRDGWQAVDLLYGNGAFAMTVLLPTDGRTPGQLVADLSAERWAEVTGRFEEQSLTLTLPRFRVEYGRTLLRDLRALGMSAAFSAQADFSRIASDPLYITRVDQKSFVEVNEEGTEAAAATGVGFERTAVTELRVDRPFAFAIRERLSGAVMVLGVMNTISD